MRIVVLALVAVPVIGFSIGCMLPGCGSDEPPDEPFVGHSDFEPTSTTTADAEAPEPPDTGATTGDTAVAEPVPDLVCDEGEAAVEIAGLEDVALIYGRGCDHFEGQGFELIATGLSTDTPVEASWTVSVEGRDSVSGATDLALVCGSDGYSLGRLVLGLPKNADNRAVTVDITLTDETGAVAETSVTFVATVED